MLSTCTKYYIMADNEICQSSKATKGTRYRNSKDNENIKCKFETFLKIVQDIWYTFAKKIIFNS